MLGLLGWKPPPKTMQGVLNMIEQFATDAPMEERKEGKPR